MHGNLCYAMVHHSGDMSCPSEVMHQLHGINAGVLGLLLNFKVCDEVTPVNVTDGVDTALVKALEETYVTAIGDTSMRHREW